MPDFDPWLEDDPAFAQGPGAEALAEAEARDPALRQRREAVDEARPPPRPPPQAPDIPPLEQPNPYAMPPGIQGGAEPGPLSPVFGPRNSPGPRAQSPEPPRPPFGSGPSPLSSQPNVQQPGMPFQPRVYSAPGGMDPRLPVDTSAMNEVQQIEASIEKVKADQSLTPFQQQTYIQRKMKRLAQIDPRGQYRKGSPQMQLSPIQRGMAQNVFYDPQGRGVFIAHPDGKIHFHALPQHKDMQAEFELHRQKLQHIQQAHEAKLALDTLKFQHAQLKAQLDLERKQREDATKAEEHKTKAADTKQDRLKSSYRHHLDAVQKEWLHFDEKRRGFTNEKAREEFRQSIPRWYDGPVEMHAEALRRARQELESLEGPGQATAPQAPGGAPEAPKKAQQPQAADALSQFPF